MREVNGATRICGLIGNPVGHTLSPLIHNTLAQQLGHNLVYVPLAVEAGRLEAAVKGAHALDFLGLNVTVPYKSEVMDYLEERELLAEKIGAVNTLVRTGRGFKGYNTDMPGLYRALCSEGIRLEGEEIILLGAGGAARAVAFLCASKKAKKVYLLNRSPEKAKKVANEVNDSFQTDCVEPMGLGGYEKLPDKKFTVLQGTSVGLYPENCHAAIEDKEFYKRVSVGFDLIYKPAETKFMSLVREAGGQAYNGLKMLLYQGIIAYELWNQVSVPEETAKEVYRLLDIGQTAGL